MSNVVFDNEAVEYETSTSVVAKTGIPAWLIRNKFVTDEKGANMLMLVSALFSIVVAGFLFFSLSGSNTLSDAEVERIKASTQSPNPMQN